MKAVSLSISMVVTIIIAVIVLFTLSAFFISGFTKSGGTVSDADAFNEGCGLWKMHGCEKGNADDIEISGYDPDGDGSDNSLDDACDRLGINCWDQCCKP